MRRHAKATSAGSTDGSGLLGSVLGRRAAAMPAVSSGSKGTGAPSSRPLRATLAVLALAIAAFALTAAPALADSAEAPEVSEVSYTSAHLKGKVTVPSPGFGFARFQYSTDGTNWTTGSQEFVGAGSQNKVVEGNLSDLKGGTKYFARISLLNLGTGGTETASPGPNPSFTTLTVDPPSVVSIDNASDVAYTTATVKGKVNRPANADPAFDVDCHFQYVTDQQFNDNPPGEGFTGATVVDCEPNPVKAPGASDVEAHLAGLANDTTYHLRLVVSNASPTTDAKIAASTFKTLKVDPPSVISTGNATAVEYTQAQVKGVVERPANADPAFNVECNFEYVTDDQYKANELASAPLFEGATPVVCEPEAEPTENPITATGPTPVKATLGGLVPSTSYHLRLSATNLGGTDSKEAAATFTTAGPIPKSTVITANDATDPSYFSAKASGEIQRPEGADPALNTSCRFEYVSDQQFNDNPPGEEFAGAGQVECVEAPSYAPLTTTDKTPVSAELTGLKSATTFHLRLSATNFGGSASKEAASTFTTLTATPPVLAIDSPTSGYAKAHISGTVDPEGGTVDPTTSEPFPVSWQLQYALSSDPGNWQFGEAGTIAGAEAQGTDPIAVAKDLEGLKFDTEYKFRLIATYADREAISSEGSFTTKPVEKPIASLDTVTTITDTTAKFTGSVDSGAPAGPLSSEGEDVYETTWHIECQPECPGLSPATVKAGEGTQPFSINATGLEPNLSYEVKLVATNAAGTASDIATFPTKLIAATVANAAGGSDGEGGYFLQGTVNPHNSPVTDCHFVYGPNSAEDPEDYAFAIPCSPATPKGRDEVQQLSVHASGGQFKLTYRGQSTADLPFDASAAEVQTALEGLAKIGPGSVAITASSRGGVFPVILPDHEWTVTFQDSLGETNVAQIAVENGTVPLSSFNPGGDGARIAASTTVPGTGNKLVTVEGHVTSLTSDTEYHFRLVVTNAADTVITPDQGFVPTLAPKGPACENEQLREENGSLGLPECRAYEMVTYPNKEGNAALFQDFNGGDAVEYLSGAGNLANSGQSASLGGPNFYVATRTDVGWQTIPDLNGPTGSFRGAPEFVGSVETNGIKYSADLLSSLYPVSGKKGSPATLFRRRPDGGFEAGDAWRAGGAGGFPIVISASDDLSHLILGATGSNPTVYGPGVYEFVGISNDQPRRVDLDNSGSPITSCQFLASGSAPFNAGALFNSGDGRVIVVEVAGGCGTPNPPATEIWARVDGTTSFDVSASQCNRTAADPGGACNAPVGSGGCNYPSGGGEQGSGCRRTRFQAAAKDASRVYFTTAQQLVNGDTDQTNDLYACDIPTAPQAPVGEANPCAALHEASAGTAGKADVQQVLKVSDDGSTAYFTAKGVLAENEDALEQQALAGDNNLYVWRTDAAHPDGQIAFVARLTDGASAQTTPDGRYLLLQTASQLLLTDTDESIDIYRYDADTGEMARVSTAVSGAGGNGKLDATVAAGTPHNSHPAISDDGRLVVFKTNEPLSPLDGNGEPDAYLWNDGHALGSVAPLLPGSSAGQKSPGKVFIDGSGHDVYIETAARLNPTDVDFTNDVYDARVGGGFPQHQEGCAGETCQPPAPNPPPAPASPANRPNGEGNIAPKHCRKGKILKGNRCVKKPKRHSAKKHQGKKASHKQGGGK